MDRRSHFWCVLCTHNDGNPSHYLLYVFLIYDNVDKYSQNVGILSYFYDQGSDIGVIVTLWHTTDPENFELIPTWQFAWFLTVTQLVQYSLHKLIYF